ncbi:MAG: hypothetical protein Kow0056_09240 [Coriobacteriia bacterium]
MAARNWIADGLVVEAPEMAKTWRDQIGDAWDCVVLAREAFLREEWEKTDKWAREACRTAAEALLFSRGWRPTIEFDLDVARDYSFDTFGGAAMELITRAGLVGEFLPVDYEIDGDRKRLFEKTLAAASEFVAMVECHIAVEQSPPKRDPHVPRQYVRPYYGRRRHMY